MTLPTVAGHRASELVSLSSIQPVNPRSFISKTLKLIDFPSDSSK